MKSSDDEDAFEDCQSMSDAGPVVQRVEILSAERWSETASEISMEQTEDSTWTGQIEDSYSQFDVSLTGQIDEFPSITAVQDVSLPRQTDAFSALNEEIIYLRGHTEDIIPLPEREEVEVVTSDTEAVVAHEPVSEMYYTASSEVSLLSDEMQDRLDEEKGEKKECVIAGHVAAMRERFESMTRTNTPCPDLMRSTSPSLDAIRNITPSPDHLLG